MLILLFHGGMVAFLFIHNFLIPFVRNLGNNTFAFYGIHFWFVSQFLLFALLFRDDFSGRGISLVPLAVRSHSIAVLIGLAYHLFNLATRKNFTVEHFSLSLSFLAQGIFFILYYVYFQNQFPLRFHWEKQAPGWILAIAAGTILFGTENFLTFKLARPLQEILGNKTVRKTEQSLCQRFNPSGQFISAGTSRNLPWSYDDCGFINQELVPFHSQDKRVPSIMNHSQSTDSVRLEKLIGEKWYPKRIIHLLPGQLTTLRSEDFAEEGIYRLRSGLSPRKGMMVIESRRKEFLVKGKIWVSLGRSQTP